MRGLGEIILHAENFVHLSAKRKCHSVGVAKHVVRRQFVTVIDLERRIKCESANSTTCKVRNKMRKHFIVGTQSALVTDWFIRTVHYVRFRRLFGYR